MSTPPRANDPETGQPYASPTALHKLVAWFWSKYSRKVLLKIGVVTAPVINAVVQWTGNTPQSSQAIGIGLSALLLGALDFVISYVGKKMGFTNLESLQKLSEEQEQPAIPYDANIPGRSAMWAESRRVGMLSPSQVKAGAQLTDDESAWLASQQATQVIQAEPCPPKLAGYSVECDGEVHDFIDKLAAIQFRNSCRADGKTASLL